MLSLKRLARLFNSGYGCSDAQEGFAAGLAKVIERICHAFVGQPPLWLKAAVTTPRANGSANILASKTGAFQVPRSREVKHHSAMAQNNIPEPASTVIGLSGSPNQAMVG